MLDGADAGDAPLVRVLTIGDGDCSFSLALARAFAGRIALTVTTLPDEDELTRTYKAAAANLAPRL